MNRKLVKVLGVGLVLTLFLGATLGVCHANTKLVWAEWWDPEWGEDTIEWIIDAFEDDHPDVEVEACFVPPDYFS